MPARRQSREEIRQIDVLKREVRVAKLLAPVWRRLEVLPRLVTAKLVVGGALFRILEGLVSLRDLLEFFLALGILGNVRVIVGGEFPIVLFYVLAGGAACDPENTVVVLIFHQFLRAARSGRLPPRCEAELASATFTLACFATLIKRSRTVRFSAVLALWFRDKMN